jgi:hypothetical protein
MIVRPAEAVAIWNVIGPAIRGGDVFALDPTMSDSTRFV